jgi:hypothetical protein
MAGLSSMLHQHVEGFAETPAVQIPRLVLENVSVASRDDGHLLADAGSSLELEVAYEVRIEVLLLGIAGDKQQLVPVRIASEWYGQRALEPLHGNSVTPLHVTRSPER